MLFDTGLRNFFFFFSPVFSGKTNKIKNKQMGGQQTKKLWQSMGNCQQDQKETCWVGEDMSKYYISKKR